MKIVHIAPNAPYNEGWGYQENLLPKYQKKLGNDVTLFITNTKHENGKIVQVECEDYINEAGVRIVRLDKKRYKDRFRQNFYNKLEVYPYLKEINPDLIFFHGLLSKTIFDAIKYKKKINPKCVIVCDNHLDYYIGRSVKTFKDRLVRAYYRHQNRKSIKHVDKVYGVTPWRKTFAEDYFKIPANKTDVLIMGADDERIDFKYRENIKVQIRERYNICKTDFLIVTGGKIDRTKNFHLLMESVNNIENKDVKLLVFGQPNNEMEEKIKSLCSKKCIHIGWIESEKVYDYFFAADLVVFPGTHSVLWEQACASKVPCLFKRWEGMEHVNNGGNADFFDEISEESIRKKIESLINTPTYFKMKEIAESKNTDIFLYSNIAKKSIEIVEQNEI